MDKLTRRISRVIIAMMLIWVPLNWLGQNGTIRNESSLFCTRAQAAPAWLPWFGEEAAPLEFSEFYSGASALGLELSPKLEGLKGKKVRISGFMAPPLKPTLNFFVLTKVPMAICPFCSTDADWPDDIVLIKLSKAVTALPFDRPITVTGQLELGYQMDEETGFVSLVRIVADNIEEAN
ncbi:MULTISPECIES: hypothetical protein [Pelosinus]|uniref:DUF3299 domain-containing protein n=1 Tax=Pelosinus fermentans B4 TaxID=1149862 RepID=I8RKH2_9FIRM|nr:MULTISPECIES: hypothetical protein [Pelosinus]EIW18880.1 hypothetical protein FB4_0405 [Pelosinus fermentans B4]EIW21910.1 hypothetical protein FA11_0717 [Pelosinus fermentans A11]OAM95239.1 hypothetical protein FR7_03260 [Pelosinus fermentans DSM 17108]SDR25209.1 hypothetical protein SAMN04515679_3394 [Pelosinus fermentans]